MAEFSKRSEVTIETMGKVHNPSGQGIAAFSSEVKKKTEKAKPSQAHHPHATDDHDTKKIEEGSSRRNITRKKTDASITGRYDSRNKKQGGAGKGKWLNDAIIDGSEHNSEYDKLDENDPLYVAEEDADPTSYVLSSSENADALRHNGSKPSLYDAPTDKAVYGPMLTLSEFKLRVSDAVREYFDSSDEEEVVRCIDEMKCREYHPEVVKRAVSLGLDEGPRERELVSRLLASLHPNPLTDEEMERGFELLLDSIDDLVIDIPDAKAMVGSFLARAVVDEVLAPAFLSSRNNTHPGDGVVEKAVGLLSREHCTARLEKVWGPGDGRPVSELKDIMDQLLKEYLLSRELDEAASCVRELKASHFHHELVKRGVKIAMEEDGRDHASESSALDAMAALFKFLANNSIVSEYQVAKGVSRLRKNLPDLKLDVPAAAQMLDEFEGMAKDGGFLHVP
jgi:programmed cell death protein 4